MCERSLSVLICHLYMVWIFLCSVNVFLLIDVVIITHTHLHIVLTLRLQLALFQKHTYILRPISIKYKPYNHLGHNSFLKVNHEKYMTAALWTLNIWENTHETCCHFHKSTNAFKYNKNVKRENVKNTESVKSLY